MLFQISLLFCSHATYLFMYAYIKYVSMYYLFIYL